MFCLKSHFDNARIRFYSFTPHLSPCFKSDCHLFFSCGFFSFLWTEKHDFLCSWSVFKQRSPIKSMPIATSTLSINCDVVELVRTTAFFFLLREPFNDRWFDNGDARWITYRKAGWVISACYHRTKWHSARVETGLWPFHQSAGCQAPPGQWAVAWLNSYGRDRSFYAFGGDDWTQRCIS